MDHDEAVGQKAAEKYLLNELDPEARDQFEDHVFDCQDCATDLRAAAAFIEHSKLVLSEAPAANPARVPASATSGWFGWLRPAFAVPVFALLLAVVGYQNLVELPHLQQAAQSPRLLASGVVNLSIRGAESIAVAAHAGQAFGLSLNVPPGSLYASYKLDLYDPQGGLEWSRTVPAAGDEALSLYVPGRDRPGALAVRGITAAGESVDLGRYRIELQN
jgi:hypothetical protein